MGVGAAGCLLEVRLRRERLVRRRMGGVWGCGRRTGTCVLVRHLMGRAGVLTCQLGCWHVVPGRAVPIQLLVVAPCLPLRLGVLVGLGVLLHGGADGVRGVFMITSLRRYSCGAVAVGVG
jgi:hypothetical protein